MELSKREFKAMSHPVRLFSQRRIEYPLFRKFGCNVRGKDVLEIGCGSGYGAELLLKNEPLSYTGIDLMPEQIDLAQKRKLEKANFLVHDASNLDFLNDRSVDMIMDFGILHHIPEWKLVLKECYRVLKERGEFYIEEPDINVINIWDKLFHWDHPGENIFTFRNLEDTLSETGFSVITIKQITLFKFYKAVKL